MDIPAHLLSKSNLHSKIVQNLWQTPNDKIEKKANPQKLTTLESRGTAIS
jgi:hypothetical protein